MWAHFSRAAVWVCARGHWPLVAQWHEAPHGRRVDVPREISRADLRRPSTGVSRHARRSQAAAVLVTWLCCRRTVHATSPELGCLRCRREDYPVCLPTNQEPETMPAYTYVAPFLHGWFWWPHSLCGRQRTKSYASDRWTRSYLAHAHAMSAHTL